MKVSTVSVFLSVLMCINSLQASDGKLAAAAGAGTKIEATKDIVNATHEMQTCMRLFTQSMRLHLYGDFEQDCEKNIAALGKDLGLAACKAEKGFKELCAVQEKTLSSLVEKLAYCTLVPFKIPQSNVETFVSPRVAAYIQRLEVDLEPSEQNPEGQKSLKNRMHAFALEQAGNGFLRGLDGHLKAVIGACVYKKVGALRKEFQCECYPKTVNFAQVCHVKGATLHSLVQQLNASTAATVCFKEVNDALASTEDVVTCTNPQVAEYIRKLEAQLAARKWQLAPAAAQKS